jgi:hypothetical protein
VTQKQYTNEVMDALRQQAALRGDDPPPAPDGQVRYHIAVEQNQHSGTAPAATVAAILRSLADHLDQTSDTQGDPHG